MRSLLTLLFALMIVIAADAQPANDNPCGALPLAVTESADPCVATAPGITLVGITYLPLTLPASCNPAGNTSADMWFSFTAPSTPNGTAPFTSKVSVYYSYGSWVAANLAYFEVYSPSACNGPYSLFTCWGAGVDFSFGFVPQVIDGLVPGGTYLMRYTRGAFDVVNAPNIKLCITTGLPPSNARIGVNTTSPQTNFDVAGTTRFRNNVGIGTQAPTAPLHVVGGLRLQNGSEGADKVLTSDANGVANWQTPAPAPNYWTLTGNDIYKNNSGNVGIGTSTPGFLLDFGTGLGDKISLYGSSGPHYGFGIQGNLLQIHTDLSQANIAFGYGSSDNFTERVRIFNDGDFGMRIRGRVDLFSAGQSAGLWLSNQTNTERRAFVGMANDNLVGFFGGNGGGWGMVMNTNTGNMGIGIGAATPSKPLSFPATLGEKILLYPGSVGEVGIGVYGNELRLHADNANAKVSFGTQTVAGVFSENAKAERNGVFAFSIFGSLWVNGTTYASDERFKKNIRPISTPLQKLMQLNGVSYEMKTDAFPEYHFASGVQTGLIAQQVEKVAPDAVSEKDGYKGVDYAKLVPLLIECIKAQQLQIEALQRAVNANHNQ
jgi:Chaperone of endosialidase